MSRCMYSVAMCDGGGGTVDFSTLLDMKSVLDDQTEEQTTRVLYADTIDRDAVSESIDKLYEYANTGGLGPTTSSLIQENDDLMKASNSPRFYTGEAAVAQFSAMGEVNGDINALLANIDDIYKNKATILQKVDDYNSRLCELKKSCRINLLRDAAHKYNHRKVKDYDESKDTSANSAPGPDTVFTTIDDLKYVQAEAVWQEQYVENEGTILENTRTRYTWRHYKLIYYWSGLIGISWFRDPGFEEVEKMFADVGEPLPYDPAKILPKE